jgi:hypothetical protein
VQQRKRFTLVLVDAGAPNPMASDDAWTGWVWRKDAWRAACKAPSLAECAKLLESARGKVPAWHTCLRFGELPPSYTPRPGNGRR